MKVLIAKGQSRVFGYKVGDLVVFVPDGVNPKKPLIKITLEETPARVPISQFVLTLEQWLGLIEQAYESMIKAGWPEEYAKQFLPKAS